MPIRTDAPKSFIFCVHAHQPVGNFGSVFEDAVDKCYSPFFDAIERHPKVPVAYHMSGSLIDWLETNRPDFIKRLQALSKVREIEFLGGAYYEPIYGLIPARDLVGQIARMRSKIETLFGQTPAGAWLTERVWDPELAAVLTEAGIEYTVLDDVHFEKAGVRAPVTGYYRDGGLDLFASMKSLRYMVPFRETDEVIRHLRSMKTGPERAIVFADDLEKFGMWPGTARWVYGENNWLDRFFAKLEKEPGVRATTFSRFRREHGPVKNVTVPHASYEEMMQWSGGRFDNFFEKYPESRYMKERMLHVSGRVADGAASGTLNGHLEESTTALYRAQCNCPYWHGIFGGLYLHHLRSSVFENLIKADASLPAQEDGFERLDFGSGERWQLRQRDLASFFNPGYGAALEELDFLPKSTNLLCTLQRRPEPYHRFVMPNFAGPKAGAPLAIHQMLGVKQRGLEAKLNYDSFRRLSFLDHFFPEPAARADFERSRCQEAGDFTAAPYEASPEQGALRFERLGTLELGRRKHALRVSKTVSAAGADTLRVVYGITNESESPLRATFGVEFNFSIGEESLAQGGFEPSLRERTFRDSWRRIEMTLRSDREVSMMASPLETVSESEGGIEGTYQQLAVLLQAPLSLEPGQTHSQKFELEVR